jgi:hypothetical protein
LISAGAFLLLSDFADLPTDPRRIFPIQADETQLGDPLTSQSVEAEIEDSDKASSTIGLCIQDFRNIGIGSLAGSEN